MYFPWRNKLVWIICALNSVRSLKLFNLSGAPQTAFAGQPQLSAVMRLSVWQLAGRAARLAQRAQRARQGRGSCSCDTKDCCKAHPEKKTLSKRTKKLHLLAILFPGKLRMAYFLESKIKDLKTLKLASIKIWKVKEGVGKRRRIRIGDDICMIYGKSVDLCASCIEKSKTKSFLEANASKTFDSNEWMRARRRRPYGV